MSKIEFDKRKGKELYFYCNWCQTETNHVVITGVDHTGDMLINGEPEGWFCSQCDIVQCGGCKVISFTKKSYNSESVDPYDKPDIEQYPAKEENAKSTLGHDVYDLPDLVEQVYTETQKAIVNKLTTLAGIGLRAIIEIVCKDKGIKIRGISVKIDELVKKGFITKDGAEVLHGIGIIGNAAAHDGKAPTRRQIDAAVKIIDHLLLGIYIIPEQAANALPKRQKKTTKKKTAKKTGAKRGKK